MAIRNIPQHVVNFSQKGEICRGDMLCQIVLLDISETAGKSRAQPLVLILIIVIDPTLLKKYTALDIHHTERFVMRF